MSLTIQATTWDRLQQQWGSNQNCGVIRVDVGRTFSKNVQKNTFWEKINNVKCPKYATQLSAHFFLDIKVCTLPNGYYTSLKCLCSISVLDT